MDGDNVKVNLWTYDETDDPFHVLTRGIEADVHAHGWDGPARLGLLLEHTSIKDGNILTAYSMAEIPMFRSFYENPVTGLNLWVTSMLQSPEAIAHLHQLIAQVADQFQGWVFVSEAWTQQVVGTKLSDGGRPLVSPESGTEGRICILVTKGEHRIIQVNRSRNKDGGLDDIELIDSDHSQGISGGFAVWNLVALTALSELVSRIPGEGDVRMEWIG